MTMLRSRLTLAALCAGVLSGPGCHSATLNAQLEAVLNEQAEQWNRGSIDGFMRCYVHGDELTFSSGGEVRRGWDATAARFKQRYPNRAAMGRLSFGALETMALGARHALMLGRWQLQRDDGDIGGAFSLVWRRTGRRWLILHDHTTQSLPAP